MRQTEDHAVLLDTNGHQIYHKHTILEYANMIRTMKHNYTKTYKSIFSHKNKHHYKRHNEQTLLFGK